MDDYSKEIFSNSGKDDARPESLFDDNVKVKDVESDYAQAVGVLRELEKTLISREAWQRAADAPDVNEAIRYMGNDYDFASMRSPDAYEPILQAKLAETYETLYKLCVEREYVDILNLKYVFHNLKVLVKASVSDYAKENSASLYSGVAKVDIDTIIAGEKGGCPEYATEARLAMEAAYAETKDPQAIDMEGDRLMYKKMLELAEEKGNEFILRFVRMSIDLYNLKLLMRVKNMQRSLRFLQKSLISGGETGTDLMRDSFDKPFDVIAANCYYKYFGEAMKVSEDSYAKNQNYSTLEKLSDDLITNHISSTKYIAFGPEPLFAYIVARENEIRQIRIVITCKNNQISDETLRERLRDLNA